MLRNDLITVIKYLSTIKLSSFLKIIGLSTGITSVLLVILFIQFEFSVDRFHHKIDNIYRLLIVGESRGNDHALKYYSDIVQSRARFLRKFPEIKRVVRLVPEPGRIKFKDTWIRENRFWLTDPNIFDMLTMPLRYGDSKTVLEDPNSVVLTPATAAKYFGENDPLGKTIRIQFSIIPVEYTFKVTGILEPLPKNSSMQIDFLAHIPFERFSKDRREMSGNMSEWVHALTLVELDNPSFYPSLQDKLRKIRCHDADKSTSLDNMKYQLEPLKQAYLKSKAAFFSSSSNDVIQRKGDVRLIVTLMVLGLSAFVISCANIINFSPHLANLRLKQVDDQIDLHKIRMKLIVRCIIENVLMSCLAILLSLVLLELLLPLVNTLFNRDIAVSYADNWIFWLCLFGAATLAALLSSTFPVLVLSSLKLEAVSRTPIIQSYPLLRKGLIISQIGLCATVLILSLVIWDGLNAFKGKDVGFNTKNLIFFQVDDENLVEHYPAFKEEIMNISGVKQMTASNYVPWSHGTMYKFAYYDDDAVVIANTIFADPSFLETYQIPVVDGDGFSTKWTEMPGYVIINEKARQILQSSGTDPLSKALGIPVVGGSPIGSSRFWQHRVQGIIQDIFTFYPSNSIPPLAILPSYHFRYLRIYVTIRLADHNQTNILSQVEEVVKHFYPQSLFDFKYITEEMENMHRRKMDGYLKTIIFTVGFAIFITMIGLFGYATYETDRYTKEIGVRKALGAKPVQIANYFILRFVKLVLIANIISWPISYLFIRWVFKEFDCLYPLQISIKHLLLVGLYSLLLTIIVVSVQVYRAALVDPAKVLRHEWK